MRPLAHSTERRPARSISWIENLELTPKNRIPAATGGWELKFNLNDEGEKQIRLDLEPNTELTLSANTLNLVDRNGGIREIEPGLLRGSEAFKGRVSVANNHDLVWRDAGWARVVLRGIDRPSFFEGAFSVDGDVHHVQTASNYRRTRHPEDPQMTSSQRFHLVVRKDSEVMRDEGELRRSKSATASCGYHTLEFNQQGAEGQHPLVKRQDDFRGDMDRFDTTDTIGDTSGCPSSRRIALVGVATDCTYTSSFDSLEDVRANIISQINTASQVYEDAFNISLRLANLTISDGECPSPAPSSAAWNLPCSDGANVEQRLELFSRWRSRFEDERVALWTLLTTCNTGSTVGISWIGQVCTQGARSSGGDTVAATNVVVKTSNEWQVLAHEIGHSFGAVHDCTDDSCDSNSESCCRLSRNTCDANGEFIMNPTASSNVQTFSPCTIGSICSAMGRNLVSTDCLVANVDDVPSTATEAQCGNGIVEEGEDCDCGGTLACARDNNTCCNASTCRFVEDAVCDPATDGCCNDQCQPASSGRVCRASNGACDPEETCDGTSTTCPEDVQLDDGDVCTEDGEEMACASGRCTSRQQQCMTLLESNSSNIDACNDRTCSLSCMWSGVGRGTCSRSSGDFLDGTPCGAGGRCYGGSCRDGGSGRDDVGGWFTRERIIIIASSIGGGIILFVVAACVGSWWRRRKRRNVSVQEKLRQSTGT